MKGANPRADCDGVSVVGRRDRRRHDGVARSDRNPVSGNSIVDDELWQWVPEGVSAHVNRLDSVEALDICTPPPWP